MMVLDSQIVGDVFGGVGRAICPLAMYKLFAALTYEEDAEIEVSVMPYQAIDRNRLCALSQYHLFTGAAFPPPPSPTCYFFTISSNASAPIATSLGVLQGTLPPFSMRCSLPTVESLATAYVTVGALGLRVRLFTGYSSGAVRDEV